MIKQMTTERREAYVQILEVLNRVDEELYNKIPKEIIDVFNKNKLDEYEFVYDEKVPLEKQNINDTTKTILAFLNLNFWCEDNLEKEELIQQYTKNEKLYEEVLQMGFEPEKIFKTTVRNEEKTSKETMMEETNMVEYKESLLKKIFKQIINIFKKHKN